MDLHLCERPSHLREAEVRGELGGVRGSGLLLPAAVPGPPNHLTVELIEVLV